MQSKFNKLLLSTISFLQGQLISLAAFISQPESSTISLYDDLSPVDEAENSEPYLNALTWALKNPNIKNLALTGPYGSGKTSILKTFEKKNPFLQFLNISLASFQDDIAILNESNIAGANAPLSKTNYEERHRLIELSILQQMFYRVRSADIPDSRFNRIRSLGNWTLLFYVFVVFLTLLGLTVLFAPGYWHGFTWWKDLDEFYRDLFQYAGFTFIVPAIFFISRYTIRLFNFSKFNKINLTKGELEFDPKSETSILNKHLDEILYYFQVTPVEVVFIEDLDRFNDPEIFTKLRELNNLINQSKQVGRRIVFVYVIKDDMFKDRSRTKFFDFIIPVVPVINSSNSFNIMLRKIENTGLDLRIGDTFLSNVTLFIDDMRALKNIFNEFLLYRESLTEIKLKDEELFAMIVYKNIYPDDFAALHEQKGTLFSVFQQMKSVKDKLISELSSSIAKIEAEINGIKDNTHLSSNELRMVYLFELASAQNASLGVTINNDMKPFKQIAESESDFDWLTKQTNILYYHYDRSHGFNRSAATNRSFADVETKINPDRTYKERAALLHQDTDKAVDLLRIKIESINKEIASIRKLTLNQLLKLKPDPIIHFGAKVVASPVLVYLIRNGFINEQYNVLISYFYPGHLTVKDMDFALTVAKREPKDFDFELTKIDKLISRLDADDFNDPVILNYKLADYLMANQSAYKKPVENLVKQLSNGSEISLSFMDGYFDQGKQKIKLFSSVLKSWSGFWDFVANSSDYPKERQISYLKFIAANVSSEIIESLNIDSVLKGYVEDMDNFLEVFKDNHTAAHKLIDTLSVDFKNLNFVEEASALFDHIYNNWNYKINRENIRLVISQKAINQVVDLSELDKMNFTLITKSGAEHLIAYIDKNLEAYIETLVLGRPENTEEDEYTIINLLNQAEEKLTIANKEKLIRQQNAKITDITTVQNKILWTSLLIEIKIVINWPNVFSYFEYVDGMDEVLFTFLSRPETYNVLKLTHFDTGTNRAKEVYYNFSRQTLLKSEFDDAAYDALLLSNPYHYTSPLNIEALSATKVEKLITRKVIHLSPEQFSTISSHFKDLVGSYIAHFIIEFQKDKASYTFNVNDYTSILKSSLNPLFKIQFVNDITDDQLESNSILASYAGRVILAQTVFPLSEERLSVLIKKGIFKDESLALFLKYLGQMDLPQIDELLGFQKDPYKKLAVRGKQVSLPNTAFNTELVNALRKKGFIKNPAFKDTEIRVYNKKTL
jgi:hypothetical protein